MKTLNSERLTVSTTRLKVPPEGHKEFFQTIVPLTERIRQESGCLDCRLFKETGNGNTILLVEEWSSEANWTNYREGRTFAALLGMVSVLSISAELDFKLLTQIEGNEAIEEIT